jgi:hypothetical protein
MISIYVAGSQPGEREGGEKESKKVSRVEARQVGFHVAAGAKKNKQKAGETNHARPKQAMQ